MNKTNNNKNTALVIGFLLCVALFLYYPVFFADYVWDDTLLFVDNAALVDAPFSWEILSQPVLPGTSYFRPLIFLTWYAEFAVFGRNPFVSHLINFVILFINAVLVFVLTFLLANSLQKLRPIKLASIASILYLIHPALIESTAWVSGRFDQLTTTFVLLSCVLFVRYTKGAQTFSLGATLGICISFLLALFSKELGVMLLPILLCLYFILQSDGVTKPSYIALIAQGVKQYRCLCTGLIAAFIFYMVLRRSAMHQTYHAPLNMDYVHSYWFNLIPWHAYADYVKQTFLPFYSVSAFHTLDSYHFDSLAWYALLAISAIAFFAMCYFAVIKRSVAAWLMMAAFLSIALVLHIIPLTINDNLIHERFMTLGLAFWSMAMVFIPYQNIFDKLKLSQQLFRPILFLVAVMWGGLSVLTVKSVVPFWHNELTLWHWVYQDFPDNQYARYNYWSGLYSQREFTKVIEEIDAYQTVHKQGLQPNEQSLYASAKMSLNDSEAYDYLQGVIFALPKFHELEGDVYEAVNNSSLGFTPKDIGAVYIGYAQAALIFKGDLITANNALDISLKYLQPYEQYPALSAKVATLYLSGQEQEAMVLYQKLRATNGFSEMNNHNINAAIVNFCEKFGAAQCASYTEHQPFEWR